MKKLSAISLIALAVLVSACSLSSQNTNTSGEKLTLKACLMSEAQKQVANGRLADSTLTSLAKEIATTCATKLALGGTSDETVQLATQVLKTFVQ